jgi:hypothetical protein
VKAVYSHNFNTHMFTVDGGESYPAEVDMKRPVTKATIPSALQEL